MSFTSSLIAKLGMNNAEFKAKLKESVDESKSFERGWKDLGKLFAAGGITTAVIGFFRSMIEHAREATGQIDSNTAAVRRFGDSWDSTVKGAKNFGVQFLGTLNQVGEYIGLTLKGWARGFSNFWEHLKNLDFKEAFASFSKGLEEVAREEVVLRETEQALFETQERIAKEGKRRAAEAKKQREEEKEKIKEIEKAEREAEQAREKAAEAHMRLMDKKAELQFEALSTEEQIQKLAKDEETIRRNIAKMKREGVDTTATEIALIETQNELAKRRAKHTKEEEDSTSKLLLSEEEMLKLSEEQLPQQIKLVEAAILKAKAEGRVTAELEAQLRLLKEIVEKKKEDIAVTNQRGRDNEDLSDRELKEKAHNLRTHLEAAKASKNSIAFMFERDLQAVEFELGRRAGFRRAYAREGEAALERYSAFDEQTLRNYVRPEDEKRAQQTLETLQDIQQRLSGAKPIFGGATVPPG
jgi:hypothetical protein